MHDSGLHFLVANFAFHGCFVLQVLPSITATASIKHHNAYRLWGCAGGSRLLKLQDSFTLLQQNTLLHPLSRNFFNHFKPPFLIASVWQVVWARCKH